MNSIIKYQDVGKVNAGLMACNFSNQKNNYTSQKKTIILAKAASIEKWALLRQDYAKNPKLCFHCFKLIEFNLRNTNTYCSRSCSASVVNLGRKKSAESKIKISLSLRQNSINSGRSKKITCESCKSDFHSTKKLRFCNWTCYESHNKNNCLGPSGRVVNWRQKKKALAVEYFGGGCELCGYDKCVRSLHFHHKDPSKKDFQFSGKTIAWQKLLDELEKCALLCSNCHGEVHHGLISLLQ